MQNVYKALSYDDVALVPKKSVVKTRSQCSTECDFLGRTFKMPVMPANMRASIDTLHASWLSQNRYFYSLHRFYPYETLGEWVRENQHLRTLSMSIGIRDKDYDLIDSLYSNGYFVDYLTVDVAHGHSTVVEAFLLRLKALLGNKTKLICGNVVTSEGAQMLKDCGCDAVKVGIGQGHVCTTRLQTGFGVPMFDCVRWVAEDVDIPIIADGGIKHYGDVAKALVAGADMVMVGSMFARCVDSPAETIGDRWTGPIRKRWFGSASEHNTGSKRHIEGVEVIERSNGLCYGGMLQEWKEALQSAISYAGGTDLIAFKTTHHIVI